MKNISIISLMVILMVIQITQCQVELAVKPTQPWRSNFIFFYFLESEKYKNLKL